MKKLFGLAFLLMMTVSVFGKEIPLNVTQTDWGFEISNLDAKGKRICAGNIFNEYGSDYFIILKTKRDEFSIEKFADYFIENQLNPENTIVYYGGSIQKMKNGMICKASIGSYSFSLKEFDSILVVPSERKFEKCVTFWDGTKLHIELLDETEKNSVFLGVYYEKKKQLEEEVKRVEIDSKMSKLRKHGDFNKNNSYIYTLTESGKVKIAAYIGSSVDNLVIPETIEELPVEEIGMGFWKYYEDEWPTSNDPESIAIIKTITCKTVTIPKTVIKIADCAFEKMGIEKIIIANGSILKSIGIRTFAENKIKEYNIPQSIVHIGNEAFYNNQIEELRIPRKELVIGNRAFDSNKIKKVNIFSGWAYKDDNERFNHNHPIITNSEFLEEVVFENGCKDIVGECFEGCTQLRKVTIPTSIKRIWARAFKNCSSLSEIVLNGKFKIDNKDYWNTYFDKESFYGCPLPIKTKSELLQAGLTPEAF